MAGRSERESAPPGLPDGARSMHEGPVRAGVIRFPTDRFAMRKSASLKRRAGSYHSTVTDLARLRGWSTSFPSTTAVW